MKRAVAGFSLIELIVALTILSITLLGLAGAAAVAYRSFTDAEVIEHATEAAAAVLDSLLREPAPRGGVREEPGRRMQWQVREDSLFMHIDLTITVPLGAKERVLTFTAVHHAR